MHTISGAQDQTILLTTPPPSQRAVRPRLQTNGKIERFHRSFKAEVLVGRNFADHASAQRALDAWREVYSRQRPHEALPIDNNRVENRIWPIAMACS